MAPVVEKCLELFRFERDALSLSLEERRVVGEKATIVREKGFDRNELAKKAPISFLDEALVVVFLTCIMTGPLIMGPSFVFCAYFYGLKGVISWIFAFTVLATHPLPTKAKEEAWRCRLTRALYRYFSYRVVWSGNAKEACCTTKRAWIGAGPPHGVVPIANVLSIPAMNSFARPLVGGVASVSEYTPFLRYLCLFGTCDVSAASIAKCIDEDLCVGTVPDGIAGIFAYDEDDEIVILKSRKGIAKLALRTGAPILPAYSVGNTQVYTAVFDNFGICEHISRKIKASIFFFYGRFGLAIPRRVNITMLVGDPILVGPDKIPDPTPQQIDELHDKLLKSLENLFNQHKASLGWHHKRIVFK